MMDSSGLPSSVIQLPSAQSVDNHDEKSNVLTTSPGLAVDNPNNDILISDSLTDSVTSLYYSPRNGSTDIIVTTWDHQIRLYRTTNDASTNEQSSQTEPSLTSKIPQFIAFQSHSQPVLDSCWNRTDANKVYSVGCDKVIKVWDLEKNFFCDMDVRPRASSSPDHENMKRKKPTTSTQNPAQNDDSKQEAEPNQADVQETTKHALFQHIKQWHPEVADEICAEIVRKWSAAECQQGLDNLVDFRVKVDNLALSVHEEKMVGQNRRFLHHAAPIRCIQYIAENNVIITGGWDKKLKFWDTRSKVCCGAIDLGHKVYCMAAVTPVLAVGLSNNYVQAYDLRNPTYVMLSKQTPLKHQLRCMDIFPSKEGFAVGSIDGRVAVEMIDSKEAKRKNFSFKCHRHNSDAQAAQQANGMMAANPNLNIGGNGNHGQRAVYGVNALTFHPNGSFVTGGSDGVLNYWDRIGKAKIHSSKAMQLPVVAASFNYNASLLAYATSYDWSHGNGAHGFAGPQQHKPQIYIHEIQSNDLDKRALKQPI